MQAPPAPPPPPQVPRPPSPPAPPPPPVAVVPEPPKRYRLLEDHRSHFKKSEIYGRKGDEVTEISVSDQAVIVESKDGNRYPIHKSKLIQI